MANEEIKELVHGLVADLEAQQTQTATLNQRLAAVLESASSTGDLVTAWVNAHGILIQVKFHPEAVERAGGLEGLGRYVTEATQKAAQQAKSRADEITEPLRAGFDKLPKLSDIFPGMPDPDEFIPTPVDPSLAPPDAEERVTGGAVFDSEEHYEDIEQSRPVRRGPFDQAW